MGITSVHDLSDEIPECVPWDRLVAIRVCLLEVVLEETHRDREVGVVEIIAHVPSDLPILSPLLHDRVEEREHEYAGLERWVRAVVERVVGHLRVRCEHVELQAVRRLGNDLHEQSGALQVGSHEVPSSVIGLRSMSP